MFVTLQWNINGERLLGMQCIYFLLCRLHSVADCNEIIKTVNFCKIWILGQPFSARVCFRTETTSTSQWRTSMSSSQSGKIRRTLPSWLKDALKITFCSWTLRMLTDRNNSLRSVTITCSLLMSRLRLTQTVRKPGSDFWIIYDINFNNYFPFCSHYFSVWTYLYYVWF